MFFRPLPIIQKMHGVCLVDPFLVNNVGVQYFLKVFPRSIPFLRCFHNAARNLLKINYTYTKKKKDPLRLERTLGWVENSRIAQKG